MVDVNQGGRTTFKNAARTERRGFGTRRAERDAGPVRRAVRLHLPRCDVQGGFLEHRAGQSGDRSGRKRAAGRAEDQAYAQLSYRQPRFYTYLEALYRSKVPVERRNSEFADAYTVFNLVAGLVQQGAGWRISEYVRLDNLADRNYVGSVIVNEGNGRFYEPSPRRNISAGIQASLQF